MRGPQQILPITPNSSRPHLADTSFLFCFHPTRGGFDRLLSSPGLLCDQSLIAKATLRGFVSWLPADPRLGNRSAECHKHTPPAPVRSRQRIKHAIILSQHVKTIST